MALVRLRVACRGQAELHEVDGPDIEIGRDPSCDLFVEHSSLAPRHARVLIRRNRLILTDLGTARTGTSRSGERVLAPVALTDGESFTLGDVSFAAWLAGEGDRGLRGRELSQGLVTAELASEDIRVRRYEVRMRDNTRAELAVSTPDVPRPIALAWLARMKTSGSQVPHLAPLLACEMIDGRPAILEAVPEGVRVSRLIEAAQSGMIGVPVEAMIVVLAHLAGAVAALGTSIRAHGAIDPAAVQLGMDGSIALLRPGPFPDDRSLRDELVAPERRFSFEATPEGDAFALGKIGALLLSLADGCPPRMRAICSWLAHAEPRRRPADLGTLASELRLAAMRDGLDPTYGHVARAVHALAPTRSRPLATVVTRTA
jgi:hypothetical protein